MPSLHRQGTLRPDAPPANESQSADQSETDQEISSEESSGAPMGLNVSPSGGLDPPPPPGSQANEVQSTVELRGADQIPSEPEVEETFEVEGLETILGIPDHFAPPPTGPIIQVSPLGQRLSDESAELLARDALIWHLVYWLSLSVFAIMSGEDPILVALLVEIEHKSMPDLELRAGLSHEFDTFLLSNRDNYMRYWASQTLHSAEATAFLLDVGNLLVDKTRRVRVYLESAETAMFRELRHGETETARAFFDTITHCYRVLLAEEAGRPSSGIVGQQAPAA
ncbi:hypothetical protein MMC07_006908 [Pseudocyphellaria aurata]|nr:hypothetical protein [Pseudocyphellaria aurata]